MSRAGPSPDSGQAYTEEEWQLRERLRLEAVERRTRSLRSEPVAQTYRGADGRRAAAAAPAQGVEEERPDDAGRASREAVLQQTLDNFGSVTADLEDQAAVAAQADLALLEALRAPGAAAGAVPVARPTQSRPAREITPTRRASEPPKTRPAGNASMRARFWKRRW